MTDEKSRHLERAAAQGDVEAEAKLLLERVRAGVLTEERVRLAAYLGHEAAGRGFQGSGPPNSGPPLARARLALAWLEVRAWEADFCQPAPDDREALSLIDAWVVTPADPLVTRKINLLSQQRRCRRIGLFLLDILRRGGEPSADTRDPLPQCPELKGGSLAGNWGELSRAAIRDELVPWLLGYGDPVRERVEANT